MAYISLYRKWRPQTFAEAIGQEHIVQTLTNALETGRVAHAYLFSGPRGTGKTSFARLLAKGLNCVHGPTGTPCNECDNCIRITRGTSVDVIEIDGASNRGIDEIRELRERVKYAPIEGRHKVYIIDEVHMLTNEAFNALLKVLEEPPEHVNFVFATTEAHKVPATILSRCQKFDFRRFSTAQLMYQLEKVSKSEGVEAEPQALTLIARHAEGGMRDALAILDQCVAANGQSLSVSGVTKVLGVVRREALADLAQHILDRNLAGGLKLIHALIDEGVETRQLLKDLSAYMRDLVLLKAAPGESNLVAAEGVYLEKMQEQVRQVPLEQLLPVVDTLTRAETEMRWSTNPALAIELTLVKTTASMAESKTSSPEVDSAIKALEQRVARLEEILRRGAVSQSETRAAAPSKPVPSTGPAHVERSAPAHTMPMSGSAPFYEEATQRQAAARAKPAQSAQPAQGGQPAHSAQSAQSSQSRTVVGSAADMELLHTIKSMWPDLLATLKKERYITLEAFLRVGTPGQVQGKTLVVYFTPTHRFHQANVEDPKHRTIIEQMIKRLIGRDISIATATGAPPAQILAPDAKAADADRPDAATTEAAKADTAKMNAGPVNAPAGGLTSASSAAQSSAPSGKVPFGASTEGSLGGISDAPFGVAEAGNAPSSGLPSSKKADAMIPVLGNESAGKPAERAMPSTGPGEHVGEEPHDHVMPKDVFDASEAKVDTKTHDLDMTLSPPTADKQDIRQSPSVQKALHFFGGRIVEVRHD
jgi:DNA polymerase-3 subunit gamma/tau